MKKNTKTKKHVAITAAVDKNKLNNILRDSRRAVARNRMDRVAALLSKGQILARKSMPAEVPLLGAFVQFYVKKHNVKAQSLLKKYIADSRAQFPAYGHLMLGRTFEAGQNFKSAFASYRKALGIDDFDARRDLYACLGALHKELGEWSASYEAYLNALKNDGVLEESDVLTNIGNLFLAKGDFPAAFEYYRLALKNNPRHGDAWYNLAIGYFKQGNFEQSVSCGEKAVKFHCRAEGLAYSNLAASCRQMNDFARSEKYYALAIQRLGRSAPPEFLHQRAFALSQLNRHEEAYALALRALKTAKPESRPEILFLLGCSALALSKPRQSVEHFKKLLRIKDIKFRADALCQLGWAHSSLKQYDAAARAFAGALREPYLFNVESAWAGLGWAFVRMGKYLEATDVLEQALAQDNRVFAHQSWFHLGEAKLFLDEKDEAVACFKKALSQKKHVFSGREWEMMGRAFDESNIRPEARHCYEHALEAFKKEGSSSDAKRIALLMKNKS